MKKLFLGLVVGSLIAGFVANKLGAAEARLDGRVSACKEIMGALAGMFPIPLECVQHEGDVAIGSPLLPGKLMKLSGEEIK